MHRSIFRAYIGSVRDTTEKMFTEMFTDLQFERLVVDVYHQL